MDSRKLFEKSKINERVKEIFINKNWKVIQSATIETVSDVIGKRFKDVNDITLFTSNIYYMFESEKDINKLITITTWLLLIWFLDDAIEETPDVCLRWKNLFLGHIEPNVDSKLEKLFQKVNQHLKDWMSERQLNRYKKMMQKFFESSEISKCLLNGSLKYSAQQYFDYRVDEGVTHSLTLMLELLLNIDISDETLNHSLVKEYHSHFANHICIVNDYFSYSREKSMKNNRFLNYIHLFKKDGKSEINLFEESIKIMENCHSQMLRIKEEIMIIFPNLGTEYFDKLIEVNLGNCRWSMLCSRYNSKTFSNSDIE